MNGPIYSRLAPVRRRQQWLFALFTTGLGLTAGSLADRKSTRLNSSHANISYAVFCLKKKKYKYPFILLLTRSVLLSTFLPLPSHHPHYQLISHFLTYHCNHID